MKNWTIRSRRLIKSITLILRNLMAMSLRVRMPKRWLMPKTMISWCLSGRRRWSLKRSSLLWNQLMYQGIIQIIGNRSIWFCQRLCNIRRLKLRMANIDRRMVEKLRSIKAHKSMKMKKVAQKAQNNLTKTTTSTTWVRFKMLAKTPEVESSVRIQAPKLTISIGCCRRCQTLKTPILQFKRPYQNCESNLKTRKNYWKKSKIPKNNCSKKWKH